MYVKVSWLHYIYSVAMLYTDSMPFAIILFSTVLPQYLTHSIYKSSSIIILFTNGPLLNLGDIGNKFNYLQVLPLNILSKFYIATPVNLLMYVGLNPILTNLGNSNIDSFVNLLLLCFSP